MSRQQVSSAKGSSACCGPGKTRLCCILKSALEEPPSAVTLNEMSGGEGRSHLLFSFQLIFSLPHPYPPPPIVSSGKLGPQGPAPGWHSQCVPWVGWMDLLTLQDTLLPGGHAT